MVSTGQLAYGASILSFLGGVRWGMLVNPGAPIAGSWLQYSYAVAPSLVAWSALLMPPVTGMFNLYSLRSFYSRYTGGTLFEVSDSIDCG